MTFTVNRYVMIEWVLAGANLWYGFAFAGHPLVWLNFVVAGWCLGLSYSMMRDDT